VDGRVVIDDEDAGRAVGEVVIHMPIPGGSNRSSSLNGALRAVTHGQMPASHARHCGILARIQLLKGLFITNTSH
jgi:hypothetical protein